MLTGFLLFEHALAANGWSCSSEIAPRMTRVAVFRDPDHSLRSSASWRPSRPWRTSLGVELSPVDVRDAAEIERAIRGVCARAQRWPDRDRQARSSVHRDLIIALAARHRLPAVYFVPLLRRRAAV